MRFALDSAAGRLTPAERAGRGKAARSAVPRDRHAVYQPSADRPDPVSLLEGQAATRLPDLVPVRYGRMLASPFSYFRGAARLGANNHSASRPTGAPAFRPIADATARNQQPNLVRKAGKPGWSGRPAGLSVAARVLTSSARSYAASGTSPGSSGLSGAVRLT
jgi:Uncharacterized protein conserved in bacteria (DUF2252)